MKVEKTIQGIEAPGDFIDCTELGLISVDQKLGYFGDAPLVIFAYCAGGGEVIWKDGHCSGFGAGGWKVFLNEIAPLALSRGVDLGSIHSSGTHVLLIDRHYHAVYAAPRKSAEHFLCKYYGLPLPVRKCLCGLMNCGACASHTGS
jgi:hypothetical protein